MQLNNDAFIQKIIDRARSARLSTIGHGNIPHLVPVVFVFDGYCYYLPIDKKRKIEKIEELKRIRNIKHNPNVALLIDEYYEDWSKLVFVMIQGKANLIDNREEEENKINSYENNNPILKEIHKLLYQKYPQYNDIGIGQYCIKIQPKKIIFWKNE
jgi:PPOX class probable F420-dependent enzyme